MTMVVVDPSCRFLACRYLREQLDKLTREVQGVRTSDGIEPVHQARVASRRMRAAFEMFSDCFEAIIPVVSKLCSSSGAINNLSAVVNTIVHILGHVVILVGDESDIPHLIILMRDGLAEFIDS